MRVPRVASYATWLWTRKTKKRYSSCQSSILPLIAGSQSPARLRRTETIKHLRRDGSTDAPAAYHWRQVVIAAGAPETPGAIYQ
jgi:hypothetical protein